MKLFPWYRKRFRGYRSSAYPINIRILGEEYRDKDFTGKDICRKRDIEIHFNKRDLL